MTTLIESRTDRAVHRDLVARAAALHDLLVEEQADTEQRGHYSPRLHQEFLDAGFYKMMAPKQFGGLQVNPATFFAVISEVARGNPSAGWCLALGSGHAFSLASYWPEEAQREAFGSDGIFIAPHRNQGGFGQAVQTDGGYVVSGTFNYSSGVPHSTHFMGTTLVTMANGEKQQIVIVIPRDQYTILDDWGNGATLGMQGSGSNSVTLENVFVPNHMVVPYNWHTHVGPTVGSTLHDSGLYLGRLTAFYAGEVISVAIGTARAALDEFEAILNTKTTLKEPRILRAKTEEGQRVFGKALTLIDAAASIMSDVGRLYAELGEESHLGGADFTYADDTRLRGRVHQAGQLALQAMDLIFPNAGSSAAARGTRMARYYRDMAMFRGHPTALIDSLSVGHGQAFLGQQ